MLNANFSGPTNSSGWTLVQPNLLFNYGGYQTIDTSMRVDVNISKATNYFHMKNNTLDIITISLNSGETILRTIESVRRNRLSVNSYIVIDGGSTDKTLQILNENKDVIDILISEKDCGISDAFNKGINLSTAEYILLLNSDDYIFEDSLTTIMNNERFEADLVCTIMMMSNETHGLNHFVSNPSKLSLFTSVYHPGLIVKRSAYMRYGVYDKQFRIGMDYEFVSRCVRLGATIQLLESSLVVHFAFGASRREFWRGLREGYAVRRLHHRRIFPLYEGIKVLTYVCRSIIDFLGMRSATVKIRYQVARWFF
jgi:glycosyltransferase involved in cell wall biosynthesis